MQSYVKCRWEPEKWNPSRCRHCFLAKDKHDVSAGSAPTGEPSSPRQPASPREEVAVKPTVSVSATASKFGQTLGTGANASRPLPPPLNKSKSAFVPASAKRTDFQKGGSLPRRGGSTARGRGPLKKTATGTRLRQDGLSSSKSSFESSSTSSTSSTSSSPTAFPVKLRSTGLKPWKEEASSSSSTNGEYSSTSAAPTPTPPSKSIFPTFPALWGSGNNHSNETKTQSTKATTSPPSLPSKPKSHSSSKSNFMRGAKANVSASPPLPSKPSQAAKPPADTSLVADENPATEDFSWRDRAQKEAEAQQRREQEAREKQARLQREEAENKKYKPQYKKDAHYVELTYDYNAEGVKLYAKDILELINWDDENWWFVAKDKIGFKGYVPSQYLVTIDNPANKVSSVGSLTNLKPTMMAMANFDFLAQNKGEISCKSGDVLVILDSTNPNWWFLRHTKTGLTGFIPSNYLKVLSNYTPANEPQRPVSSSPGSQIRLNLKAQAAATKAYALWDYTAASEGEISCQYADLFNVIDQKDPNWWWVERDIKFSGGVSDIGGYLPSNYLAVVDQDTIDAYCEKKQQRVPSNHHNGAPEEESPSHEQSTNCIIS